jgi:RNase H-fold protein (predicted Holliday junction resolvase)
LLAPISALWNEYAQPADAEMVRALIRAVKVCVAVVVERLSSSARERKLLQLDANRPTAALGPRGNQQIKP